MILRPTIEADGDRLLTSPTRLCAGGFWFASGPWVAGHVALALLGIVIALRVTETRRLHGRPVGWLQVLLAVLLVCMFAASVSRHVRLHMREWHENPTSSLSPSFADGG